MRWCVPLMAAIGLLLLPTPAQAQENDGTITTVPTRPEILANRWQEDWSVLADPRVPREPFDSLKYIPLSLYDPKSYLSISPDKSPRFRCISLPAKRPSPRQIRTSSATSRPPRR